MESFMSYFGFIGFVFAIIAFAKVNELERKLKEKNILEDETTD